MCQNKGKVQMFGMEVAVSITSLHYSHFKQVEVRGSMKLWTVVFSQHLIGQRSGRNLDEELLSLLERLSLQMLGRGLIRYVRF